MNKILDSKNRVFRYKPKNAFILDCFFNMNEVKIKAEGKIGIYFFIEDDEIVYVGITGRNLYERFRSYKKRNKAIKKERKALNYLRSIQYHNIDLFIIFFKPTTALSLKAIEKDFIAEFHPKLNIQHRVKNPVDLINTGSSKTQSSFKFTRFLLLIIFLWFIYINSIG